jgi:hypothetical protein
MLIQQLSMLPPTQHVPKSKTSQKKLPKKLNFSKPQSDKKLHYPTTKSQMTLLSESTLLLDNSKIR